MDKKIPVIGRTFVYDFGPNAIYKLFFVDPKHLDVTVVSDASYPEGTLNKLEIDMNEIRPNVYMVHLDRAENRQYGDPYRRLRTRHCLYQHY